ncbi:MAG: GNAT family N-acetyltransferase [Oculatellaceae cyanobacterium bins.114]|nr:GNAT family N-acetyltransferase [Oculatellaceae cyanobacterium bins.114]
MKIEELQTQEEWQEAFHVMRELRSDLDKQAYLCLLTRMVKEGYRLFALRDSGIIVSLAGIAILTNFSYGRYVWVYDLVTASSARSKGYGSRLLEFIEEVARRENCEVIALSSGLERTDAHRFYQAQMNFDKTSYVFKKTLL